MGKTTNGTKLHLNIGDSWVWGLDLRTNLQLSVYWQLKGQEKWPVLWGNQILMLNCVVDFCGIFFLKNLVHEVWVGVIWAHMIWWPLKVQGHFEFGIKMVWQYDPLIDRCPLDLGVFVSEAQMITGHLGFTLTWCLKQGYLEDHPQWM